jgi:hypothetical protein
MKNIRKSFETEFKDNLAHMERYTRLFNDEVTLAHRKRMDLETQNIKSMVGVVAEDNAGILWRADKKDLNGKLNTDIHILVKQNGEKF